MKRWTVLLGRGGTTVTAIGLALLLVSLIPRMPVGSYSNSLFPCPSKTWSTLFEGGLTPQETLRFNITTSDTLNVYILEVSSQTIEYWINEHCSGSVDFSNVTCFDQFLDSNPTSVAWQSEIHNETVHYEYIPTRITNITLALSNHSLDLVYYSSMISLSRSLVPVSKVQTLSEFAIPIGVAFTLPWLSNLLRAKKDEKTELAHAL